MSKLKMLNVGSKHFNVDKFTSYDGINFEYIDDRLSESYECKYKFVINFGSDKLTFEESFSIPYYIVKKNVKWYQSNIIKNPIIKKINTQLTYNNYMKITNNNNSSYTHGYIKWIAKETNSIIEFNKLENRVKHVLNELKTIYESE